MADDSFEFERTFGWLMHDVQRLIRRNWARALTASGVGLSEPQARILANLLRQEEGLTQTQLAGELEMEKAPLGRLLDRMEEGGYIERRPDPDDRRARRVFLSAAGAEAIPSMLSVTQQVFAEAFEGVPEHKIDVMIDVLEALKANLSPLEAESGASATDEATKVAE
jgi:MarR family transcriptional regulator, transcriptional regulator for hemolysin